MIKRNLKSIIVSCAVLCIPMIVGLVLWNQLPDQMPSHFNFAGAVDSYSSKFFGVMGLPLIMLGAQILVVLAVANDPKNESVSDKIFTLILWILPVVELVVALSVYAISLGYKVDINRLVFGLVGMIFIVIGNYLPKCRQSYTIGIRIPWTLDNEHNWNKTHRIGGYCFIIAGLLCLVEMFVSTGILMAMGTIIACVVPIIYSFILYKNGNV
ncbi:MAG: SdpI family protein [Erysipelotrichaceae bacterium]|nr:SdpI family protein [Erysipelotrichaceae bacterium]